MTTQYTTRKNTIITHGSNFRNRSPRVEPQASSTSHGTRTAPRYSSTATDFQPIEETLAASKSAANIISSINESTNVPFARVLYALGVRYVGEATAKSLAKRFGSIDALMSATPEELAQTEDVGERIAQSIADYFAEEDNRARIERLRTAGVQLLSEQSAEASSNALEGLSFVISGTFTTHSRDELKALIEANGGRNLAAVSAKTDYLVAGDNMGPAKRAKAEKLGVKIIDEGQFLEMIADAAPTTPSEPPTSEESQQNVKFFEKDAVQGSLF